jgi:hypothetical protein
MSTRKALVLVCCGFFLIPLCTFAQVPKAPVLVTVDGVRVGSPPSTSSGGKVNLSVLSKTVSSNASAYSSLDVRAMTAGSSFGDPITQARTVKLTDARTASGVQFYPAYSTLGLQISQAWGANKDQYTIALEGSSGGFRLIDYKLGGGISNVRSFPVDSERFSFSRKLGNERIAYLLTGSQLRRYNTQSNAFEDTGAFPYNWVAGGWLQLNHDETWATNNTSDNNGVTALNLNTRAVITRPISGIDEIYSGHGNSALVNSGSSSQVWNLDTNTLTPLGLPFGNLTTISHVPSMNGFWVAIDTNTGAGHMPMYRINADGTHSAAVMIPGYWGQWHNTGHWQQDAGTAQYFLMSTWASPGSGWVASWRYGLIFIRTDDGSVRYLGGHYSEGTSVDYYSQPHATQSHDGKLVVFGSNMLGGSRIDAFVMEVPTQ